jgi:hypothetical protein
MLMANHAAWMRAVFLAPASNVWRLDDEVARRCLLKRRLAAIVAQRNRYAPERPLAVLV